LSLILRLNHYSFINPLSLSNPVIRAIKTADGIRLPLALHRLERRRNGLEHGKRRIGLGEASTKDISEGQASDMG
jgi:hypothetical protein